MRSSAHSLQVATAPVLRRLEWDSCHFGFPVARLDGATTAETEIAARLAEASAEKIAVVYLFSEQGRAPSAALCARFGGVPVCRRIRYVRALDAHRSARAEADMPRASTDAPCIGGPPPGLRVVEQSRQPAAPGLRRLALVASEFSRFRLDRRFPSLKVDSLYEIWMMRSSLGQIADVVYVAETPGGEQVAVVTAAARQHEAEIGLLAVDPRYRGKGLALSLIDAVDDWARRRQLHGVAVATQVENQPACRLYERAAFQVDSIQQVTHFWIPPGTDPDEPRI